MSLAEGVLTAADRNMALAWQGLLASAPKPGRVEDDGVLLLSSGLPVGLFNPAFVSAAPTEPGAMVARIVDHYGSLGSVFALYFRDEVAPGLGAACTEAGLVEHWQPPLMVLDPIPDAPPSSPAEVRVSRLDAGNLDGYTHAMCVGFGMPRQIGDLLFGPNLLALDGFLGFVGSVDGEPVATSAMYVSDGVSGVYNVATVPEHRGRGYGEALTWAAAMAGAEAGASCSILQASEQGEPVYTRMGYATPARYRQFEPSAR
jgi:ribosomal protein S18 acetylase RimI-like enzyme